MSAAGRGRGWDSETVLAVVTVSAVALTLLVTNVGVRIGHAIAGLEEALGNLLDVMLGVFSGRVSSPAASTVVAAALRVVALTLVTLVAIRVGRRRGGQYRVDDAAARMGCGSDIEPISERAVKDKARRLGVDVKVDAFGIPIARKVAGGS